MCLFIESSHLGVLRHQNNIVFIAVVVVNGDKPVALLHEEVWQASNQLLKKTWLLTAIWKTLVGLEVSSFETWEECETRAWRLMCCVLESFQS